MYASIESKLYLQLYYRLNSRHIPNSNITQLYLRLYLYILLISPSLASFHISSSQQTLSRRVYSLYKTSLSMRAYIRGRTQTSPTTIQQLDNRRARNIYRYSSVFGLLCILNQSTIPSRIASPYTSFQRQTRR